MPRRDDVLLGELLDCAVVVQRYLARGGPLSFEDGLVQDALLLRLIRIGEIAGSVSVRVRADHAAVPWGQMRGFRNVALHEYFRLEMARVRQVAEDEVPIVFKRVLDVLRSEFPDVADSYEQRG